MKQITFTAFSKKENTALFFIGLALFAYVIARAALVPMIGDELGTFYFYIQTGNFLPYNAHMDANNHLVNSALGTLFYNLFGSAEWALRLSNVIFFPLYLFYSYRLACLLNNKVLRVGLIITLWFAHNFIEFFAYSRGYGMSMGLLLPALYYTATFIQQPRLGLLLAALFFNAFAFTANLSLLNSFALINVVLFVVTVINFKKLNIAGALTGFALLSALPGAYFVAYLFVLKSKGLLYYGTTEGFVKITLRTLDFLILGTDSYAVAYIAVAVFCILIILYAGYKLNHLKSINPVDFFTAMLAGNVAAIFFLTLVMGINYPEDRVGLYLYPLLALCFFFVVDVLNFKWKHYLAIPFMLMVVHFGLSANVTFSKQWYEDHIPRRYFDTVLDASKGNEFPPIVSGYKMRTLTWAYYNMRRGAKQNQIQETDFKNNLFSDFIITKRNEVVDCEKYYTEVDSDPVSGLLLYKRNSKPNRTLLFENTLNDLNGSLQEYVDFTRIEGDSVAGKNLLVELACSLKFTGNITPDARLCVDLTDRNDKSVGYHYHQINWLYGKGNNGEYNLKQSFVLPNIAANVNRVVIYFWDINKQPVDFTNGHISIYKVE